VLLNTPQRKHLIQYVTQSKSTRKLDLEDVGRSLFGCGSKAIRTALKREGYIRVIARRKPPLSEQNKKDQLAWAWEYLFWLDE
jgi:hypothetical protein